MLDKLKQLKSDVALVVDESAPLADLEEQLTELTSLRGMLKTVASQLTQAIDGHKTKGQIAAMVDGLSESQLQRLADYVKEKAGR